MSKQKSSQQALEALERQEADLKTRLSLIAGEAQEIETELGVIRLAGGDTQPKHAKLSGLDAERRELASSLAALTPMIEQARRSVAQDAKEQAAKEYCDLAAGLSDRRVAIFSQLEQVHRDLCALARVEDRLKKLTPVAGDLAVMPDGVQMFVDTIEGSVLEAISKIVKDNMPPYGPEHRPLLGEDPDRNRGAEFVGDKPLPLKEQVTA